jgi:hypothetical protein
LPALELSRPELLKSLRPTDAVGDPTWSGRTSLVSVGSRWDQLILLLPALLLDHDLWRGAQCCIGSMSLFAFMGDDLIDTLHDRNVLPGSPYRVVDAESALWPPTRQSSPSSETRRQVMDYQTFARTLLMHYAEKTLERHGLPQPVF